MILQYAIAYVNEEKGLEKHEVIGKDMDHVNPINHLRQKYQNNPYLYRDDIVKLVGMRENEEYINSSLNRSKGDKTWSEYIASRPKNENGDIVDNKGNILYNIKQPGLSWSRANYLVQIPDYNQHGTNQNSDYSDYIFARIDDFDRILGVFNSPSLPELNPGQIYSRSLNY
jgi:hypothetical protein